MRPQDIGMKGKIRVGAFLFTLCCAVLMLVYLAVLGWYCLR